QASRPGDERSIIPSRCGLIDRVALTSSFVSVGVPGRTLTNELVSATPSSVGPIGDEGANRPSDIVIPGTIAHTTPPVSDSPHPELAPMSEPDAERADPSSLQDFADPDLFGTEAVARRSTKGHDPYAVLRLADVRRFMLGGMAAEIGSQMQGVAVGWELY